MQIEFINYTDHYTIIMDSSAKWPLCPTPHSAIPASAITIYINNRQFYLVLTPCNPIVRGGKPIT